MIRPTGRDTSNRIGVRLFVTVMEVTSNRQGEGRQ